MKPGSRYGALFFLIAVHAVYFITALQLKGIYLVDSYGYLHQAKNIALYHTWYAEDWNAPLLVDYFSIRPPLYAWLIALFRLISANIFLLLFVQNVLSILNLWLVYRFALGQGCDRRRTGIVLIIGTLFYPAQMIHADFVMTEIVFQTLLLGIVLSLIGFMSEPTWKRSVTLAVLLSLCLLSKPVSLFLLLIVAVLMGWKLKATRQWKLLLPLLITVVLFHGICLQQQHATGYYHYTSIKAINQLKYNARYTLVNAGGEHYADSTMAAVMDIANAKTIYGERLQYMNNEGNRIIFEHPVDFLKLYIKGVAAFFIDPGRFDLYHFFMIEEHHSGGLLHGMNAKGSGALIDAMAQAPLPILLLLLLNLCWNICVATGLICFVTIKKINPFIRIILFLMIMYIAAATGPVGVSRYRVPVYPELLLAMMFTAHYFFTGNRNKHA